MTSYFVLLPLPVRWNEGRSGSPTNVDKIVDLLNVKCDPILIGSLRQQKGYFPAYHMNKDSWISILLDGSVPSDEIKNLIEISYNLTKKRVSKI